MTNIYVVCALAAALAVLVGMLLSGIPNAPGWLVQFVTLFVLLAAYVWLQAVR